MLSEENKKILLNIAAESIQSELQHGVPLDPDLSALPEELRVDRATFVTLELRGNLRGCIGSLEARIPLAKDVAHNAYQAAFHDPRFPPVTKTEAKELDIYISVLSPPEPITFTSEQDLLDQIRPGIDGLILEDGWHRGTFLPSVWEQLPKKEDFLAHLKLKAGMDLTYWSDSIKVSRYTTEYFPSPDTK